MKKALAFSILATLIGSSLALAQAPAAAHKAAPRHHPCGSKHFGKLDQNADGKVTRAELTLAHAKRFDALDQNKDGSVTPQERSLARKARHAQRARSQIVTRQAMLERVQKRFARLDLNSDGAVTQAEAARARRQRVPAPRPRGAGFPRE